MFTEQQVKYREKGLRLDSGVHRASVKVIQELAQQPQALLCWVITIEPEAAIRRVVVPLMKGLEPAQLPRQLLRRQVHLRSLHLSAYHVYVLPASS